LQKFQYPEIKFKKKKKNPGHSGFPMDGELMGAGSNNPNMYFVGCGFSECWNLAFLQTNWLQFSG
jgi:hypothetical protein